MADIKIKPLHKNILIVVGIAVLAVVLLVPGILPSIGALFTTEVSSCEDTPYDPNCTCELGIERKIQVPLYGIPKQDCEVLADLLLDPESATFETDSIAFSTEYLSRWCGNIAIDFACGTTDCVQGNPVWPKTRCMEGSWGYGIDGERMVWARCIEADEWDASNRVTSGSIPWEMWFYVESETGVPKTMLTNNNFFYNSDTKQKCATQEFCDAVANDPYTLENPGWCVGQLPMDVVPFVPDFMQSIAGSQHASVIP